METAQPPGALQVGGAVWTILCRVGDGGWCSSVTALVGRWQMSPHQATVWEIMNRQGARRDDCNDGAFVLSSMSGSQWPSNQGVHKFAMHHLEVCLYIPVPSHETLRMLYINTDIQPYQLRIDQQDNGLLTDLINIRPKGPWSLHVATTRWRY